MGKVEVLKTLATGGYVGRGRDWSDCGRKPNWESVGAETRGEFWNSEEGRRVRWTCFWGVSLDESSVAKKGKCSPRVASLAVACGAFRDSEHSHASCIMRPLHTAY